MTKHESPHDPRGQGVHREPLDSGTSAETIQDATSSESQSSSDAHAPPFQSRKGHPIPPIPDHELIAPVGRGAYGEVWLARNVMGTLRAVKIIHRSAFDNERPYEREFAGIQKFEPISRRHESQVDILHIGRNNDIGCFYYVMELADDANTATHIDPNSYQPRSLKVDLERQRRLPIDECLKISIALTTALENLHDHGLIHRDIKPANIIFVNRQPKLADIGLVAEADRTMSFVGTAGYLPPEGPGTVQADLYSLGKVMYEMATGRDRMDFPQMPTEIDAMSNGDRLFEFNEILLRACHQDRRKRYLSASALREELEMLQGGRSVRKRRSRERLWATTRRVGATLATIALLALAGSFFMPNPNTHRTPETRPLRIEYPESFHWGNDLAKRVFDWDPIHNRVVFAGSNQIHIWDEATSVTRELNIAALGDGWRAKGNSFPRWAPNGNRFVVQLTKQTGGTEEKPIINHQLFLVDPDTGASEALGTAYPNDASIQEMVWTPDGKSLTCFNRKQQLFSLSTDGGRALWLDPSPPREHEIKLWGYSPDGRWLAISADDGSKDTGSGSDIWLMPHLGGRALPLTDQPGSDGDVVWAPNGDKIYFLSAGGAFQTHTRGIWELDVDMERGLARGKPRPVLVRAHQQFWRLKLSLDGRRLTYEVTEANSRVWTAPAASPEAGVPIVRGEDAFLSSNGRQVFFAGQTPEQTGIFHLPAGGGGNPQSITELIPHNGFSVSPDDAQLAFVATENGTTGVWVVDVASGEQHVIDTFEAWNSVKPVWSPDGRWLVYSKDKVLYLMARETRKPVPLATLYRWHGWSLRWSPDGRYVAALAYANPEEWEDETGVFVVHVDDGVVRKLTPDGEKGYKEGLEWHPVGDRLTYFDYGPGNYSAKIKLAYLDGRPASELIDQEDHWDYVGVWSPVGDKFYFYSDDCLNVGKTIHVLDSSSGQIEHCVRKGSLPRWSRDRSRLIWTETAENIRYLEIIDHLP